MISRDLAVAPSLPSAKIAVCFTQILALAESLIGKINDQRRDNRSNNSEELLIVEPHSFALKPISTADGRSASKRPLAINNQRPAGLKIDPIQNDSAPVLQDWQNISQMWSPYCPLSGMVARDRC
jgi:hypothetical protein